MMENFDLLKTEVILHWITVGIYIISTFFFARSITFKKSSALSKGSLFATVGLVPHGIALLIRWYASGHGPYMAKYEVLSSISWVSILMFLLMVRKIPKLIATGVVVVPFNKLAAGAGLIALGTAVMYLLKKRQPEKELYQKLPSLEVLDEYSYKFIAFGFIFWSITTVAGSIWANQAWGRYWGWDPIETWSIITWLLYGLYLHLRYFFKWQGTRAAWLLILCFVTSVATIFLIPIIVESLHSSYFM